MASAAGSGSVAPSFNPTVNDPPFQFNTQQEREQWVNLDGARFMEMCAQSAASGNFDYVKTALRVAHMGITEFIGDRTATGTPEVTAAEAFTMLRLQQKMNAMILTAFERSATIERDARQLVTRVEAV